MPAAIATCQGSGAIAAYVARARSIAQYTASGVEGTGSSTGRRESAPKAATAARIADGLAPVHDAGLGRTIEQAHAEALGALEQRRELVRARAARRKPALAIPHELLGREPAEALREAALDLPAIDERRERVADVV
jgi:hypothetical protein